MHDTDSMATLNFRNNKIEFLNTSSFGGTIKNFSNIIRIYLSDNKIYHIDNSVFFFHF